MEKSVMRMALKDISNSMQEDDVKIVDGYGDVWVVSANLMNTKEQRMLNYSLGLSKLNYTKEAMSRKKIKQ